MEDPKINELRMACQLSRYQNKNYRDAILIFQEARRKAMDRRKFNKPIPLEVYITFYTIQENGTVWPQLKKFKTTLPRTEKFFKDWKGIFEITWIKVLANHLHRSSYYRLLHLVDGMKALIEVPSSCIVDK